MNIYFIGYRGTGKTTLGRVLSKKLKKKFVDLDILIEQEENKSIEKIFFEDGEDYFRKLEHRMLFRIAGETGMVVSTGGGVVILPENRKIIKSTGITIYLTADEHTLCERIKDDKNRPSLTSKPIMEEIKYLLSLRRPFYEELADLTLDTSKSNIDDCISRIIEFIKSKGFVL